MSWIKRRGQPSPNPTNPEVKMYNPNQHSSLQQPYQQWPQHQQRQQQPQYNNEWYNQPKTSNKQPPQPYVQPDMNNYWQPSCSNQPQQNYNTNMANQPINQYQQYNQYPNNQPANYYPNAGFVQEPFSQASYSTQNYYSEQKHAAQNIQQSNNSGLMTQVPDQMEADPWNWDWDDNTNLNTQPQTQSIPQNNLVESFANDESWNWSIEDNGSQHNTNQTLRNDQAMEKPDENLIETTNTSQLVKSNKEISMISKTEQANENNGAVNKNLVEDRSHIEESSLNMYGSTTQQHDTLEELPTIPVLRRIKNESLTPQWSVESQVSQDSSEDALLTSESDNRSNILSQSSSQSPSRPASTHDVVSEYHNQVYRYDNENVPSQPSLEQIEQKTPIKQEPGSELYEQNSQSCVNTVDKAMQGLSLNSQFENKEIIAPEVTQHTAQVKEEISQLKESTPPPLAKRPTPPLLPPPIQAPGDSTNNPYKKNANFSHKPPKTFTPKELTPQNTESTAHMQTLYTRTSAFNPPLPRPVDTMGVNLETPPDNSERPDQLPAETMQKTARKTSTVQQWPENCEVAPINDRNQYLETGQLSDVDTPAYTQSENDNPRNTQNIPGDNSDSLPPPGLMRLVLGQIEQADQTTQPSQPPGLTRMVVGGTVVPEPNVFSVPDYQKNKTRPVRFMRMIPGESSSPEATNSRYLHVHTSRVFHNPEAYASEAELPEMDLNQADVILMSERSATIGADTPPVTNQQTIADISYSSSSSVDAIPSREGAVGIDSDIRETDVNSTNTLDDNIPSSIPSDNNRREDIDGGPQEEITVRDQTVGQNTTDDPLAAASQEKGRNKNYATDSDHEQAKERHNRSSSPTGRYEKDRRYYGDRRERTVDRESPDRYKDRKYDRRRHKDRRYDDDTDYYSDKERNEHLHRDDRDEYERRYNSLRRDKDRDRRRDKGRREYDRDDRRNDYYYNRYEDDYYNMSNRSRPSSRSDSMHDSYRERNHRQHDRDHDRNRNRDRDRPRERDHQRGPRGSYNSYYQGYNYDPYNPYYQQYQYHYYENLRRTNPQAYAEWYRKYYQGAAHATGYSAEDRASVHSGRSSANEELNKDRYTRQSYYSQQSIPHYYRENFRDTPNASTVYTVDDSRLPDQTDSSFNLEDTNVVSQRLTPAKFSTAHVKASIASGHLISVPASYPLDGQVPIVEIINLQSLLCDEEQKELAEFPGPLLKGFTHKKTVIDYCESKIKKAQASPFIQDIDSYILMWELLILLLRQNGMVVGTDIAELLMKNATFKTSRRQSVSSTSSVPHLDVDHNEHRISPTVSYKEEYVTDKFREYLMYGSGKEALEWAMKHGLWGHALFLASKLDKRTYANVMMRFANGLTMNDPLQTLYQLLSGRQPAAVTSVADEKWGDWRPHLAMILSNTTQRPELDRKAITTLGDTLQSRGSLYAAHFCYLMAQVEFGRYGTQNAKLVLLGSSHQKPFSAFATNDAIFMTEIYEYACSLSGPVFILPEFQPYKYLLATRMADRGLLEKALMYLERFASSVKEDPSRVQPSLLARVCELADRLKYHDPVQEEGELENSRTDITWLTELKSLLNDYNMGLITHSSTTNLASLEFENQPHAKPTVTELQYNDQQWQQEQSTDYYQQSQVDQNQTWQTDQATLDYNPEQISYQETNIEAKTSYDSMTYQEQSYWNQSQQQQQVWEENTDVSQHITEDQTQSDYWNTAQNEQSSETKRDPETDEQPQPQISMPNQSTNLFTDTNDIHEATAKPSSPVKTKPAPVAPKPTSAGWFGGIWSKFSIRPKNQMKLPDDKNPTIVWDSEKKRWVNLEEDSGEANNEIKPPPKMSDMFPKRPSSGPSSLPTLTQNYNSPPSTTDLPKQTIEPMISDSMSSNDNAAIKEGDEPKPPPFQPNMFKLQRGRNIKKAYVDVFNPGGSKSATKSKIPAPELFSAVPSTGAQMSYFVPPAVPNPNAPTDFLTPTNTATEDSVQLSRWSSASSLSREVQYYMQRSHTAQSGAAPAMYNPNQFSNQQVAGSATRGRYPNH